MMMMNPTILGSKRILPVHEKKSLNRVFPFSYNLPFDTLRIDLSTRSPVAQLVERSAVNRMVAGSSPARGANLKERHFR